MKELLRRDFWFPAIIFGLFAARSVDADSVTLFPSGDATISEFSPESQLGGDTYIDSGSSGPEQFALRNRALIKFDLTSSIPSNAIVTSAALTLTMFKAPRPDSLWFSLHQVLQAWSEDAVTWTNRLSPPAPWSLPGGAPPFDYSGSASQSNLIAPGSVPRTLTLLPQTNGQFQFQFQFNAESNRYYAADFCGDLSTTNWMVLTNFAPLPAPADVIVSDSLSTESNRFYRVRTSPTFTFTSNPTMVADLQGWVSNPSNNFGWILICEQEDLERSKRRFYSRHATPTNRPSLLVQFTLPPP